MREELDFLPAKVLAFIIVFISTIIIEACVVHTTVTVALPVSISGGRGAFVII